MEKAVGILDAFKKKDADTLFLSLDELPKPRYSAVFSIRHGEKSIAVEFLQLDDAGIEQACRVLTDHSAKIKACRYQNIEYENMSDWAKSKLAETIARLGL